MSPSDPTTWTSSTTGYVGNTGIGTLAVDSGSSLLSSACYIGNNAGATGQVTVDGSGSTWTNSEYTTVGYYGNGTLNVTGGATVTAGAPYTYATDVGDHAGATGLVTVDGVGSTLTTGWLIASSSGSGVVNVTGGGSLRTVDVSIGYGVNGANPAAMGVITVAGTGSTWADTGGLWVGEGENGTININGGAAVTASDTVNVSPTGAINFGTGGGSLKVGGLLTTSWSGSVSGQGTINFGSSGATVTTASLAASPSQLTGTGTINTRGLITDTNLVLDSAASLTQTFTYNGKTGQNVAINLDLASNPTANGVLGAGTSAMVRSPLPVARKSVPAAAQLATVPARRAW